MFKRIAKTKHKSRQAFTLTELIVVLVILAVIAAMLVPALTGYIKRAKKAKSMQMVDAYRTAAQAVMSEFFGETDGHKWPPAVNVSWFGEMEYADKTKVDGEPWGRKVIQLVGGDRGVSNGEPYILVVGIGDPREDTLSITEKYSVYYVAYVATAKDPAIFWIDGEFSYTYPTESPAKIRKTGKNENIRNWIIREGKADYPIQYFVISNNTGKDINQFWLDTKVGLRGHSEPYFKG
ncbi:MAG: prepilin-type N-terminal cleavage/methylation domain-containing protein [Clostridiales bacterium]|nr:prepilin-type N-terminal cleavage/methylation domain-containing protein [Clostridiales bacterium]